MVQRFDVGVVGAGLAGLWCARALARRGLRIALIDAKPRVDARVRTTGIFVRRTFEEFELPRGCLGRAVRRVVLYSPRRSALTLTSERDEFRIADMRLLCNSLLYDCVRSGVRWLPATSARALHASDNGTTLDLETQGASEALAVRLVVGADGARSKVAQALGLSRNHDFIAGIEDVYDLARPSQPALHCLLDATLAPGYIAWVANDGASAHVGVGGTAPGYAPAAALRRFSNSLSEIIDLRGAVRRERRAGLIPVNGVLPRIVCERGLLVGDAAGAVSPLTAGGLDACLRLSDYAATVIAAYLGSGDVRALAGYDGRRFAARFIARRFMRTALRVANASALELACAALRLPPLRPFVEHMFFGHGSFPDMEPRRVRRVDRLSHRPAR
jgi:flavin-dependent dehydrogenase